LSGPTFYWGSLLPLFMLLSIV